MRIFKVDGTKLTLVTTAKIGTWAQGSVWSKDGKTIVVQATHEKELQVFSFDGKEAKLTGVDQDQWRRRRHAHLDAVTPVVFRAIAGTGAAIAAPVFVEEEPSCFACGAPR